MQVSKSTLAKAAAGVIALAAAFYFLAPARLGGADTYLVTYGTSMQPAYHAGDLAIVRPAASYRVGEIVAYRNMALGGHLVLHRIVAVHDGTYSFKGDNNHFVDSFHPTRAELVGALWLHVPALGRYLLLLQGPRLFLAAGLLVLLAVAWTALRPRDPARGGRRARLPELRSQSGSAAIPVVALGALAAFAALGLAAYTRPLERPGVDQGLYTQRGRFAYAAAVAGSTPVYGGGTVSTGEPLFLSLVHRARVRFAYRFESGAAHAVSGRLGLWATLAAPDGWQRTLVVAPARPFHGDTAITGGVLHLAALEALATAVGRLSDESDTTFTLTLTPRVEVAGTLAGTPVRASFAPTLPFQMDGYQLQLQPGSASGPSSSSLLSQSTSGSGPVEVAGTLALPLVRLGVAAARRAALLGAAASIAVLAAALLLARRRAPGSEADAIARRFGDLVVEVTDAPRGLGEAPTVTVGSIEGLARIAEQAGRMILRRTAGNTDLFMVEDGGVVYVYETTLAAPAAARGPRAAPVTG